MRDYCAILDLFRWNLSSFRSREISFSEYEGNIAWLTSLGIKRPF